MLGSKQITKQKNKLGAWCFARLSRLNEDPRSHPSLQLYRTYQDKSNTWHILTTTVRLLCWILEDNNEGSGKNSQIESKLNKKNRSSKFVLNFLPSPVISNTYTTRFVPFLKDRKSHGLQFSWRDMILENLTGYWRHMGCKGIFFVLSTPLLMLWC